MPVKKADIQKYKDCINDHTLDVEQFEKWVEEKFSEDDDIVGIGGQPHACPIHNYLRDVCGVSVGVTGLHFTLSTYMRNPYGETVSAEASCPSWVRTVVSHIDYAYSRRRGSLRSVTKGEVKEVILQYKADRGKPIFPRIRLTEGEGQDAYTAGL